VAIASQFAKGAETCN